MDSTREVNFNRLINITAVAFLNTDVAASFATAAWVVMNGSGKAGLSYWVIDRIHCGSGDDNAPVPDLSLYGRLL